VELNNPRLERFRQLAEKNPDNPKFLEDYVAALNQEGKLILARKLVQKLYQRLMIRGRDVEAYSLTLIHGEWVAGEEEGVRRVWSGPFLPLGNEVGSSFFGRKRKKELREGEVLFRSGQAADKIYLVTEGELAVSIRSPVSGPTLVNLVYPGDLVGEGALRDGAVRNADVFANKNSTLIEFGRQELESALSFHPMLRATLEEESGLKRKLLILSRSQPFTFLNLAERIIVAEQSTERRFPAGTVIKKEDEHLPYAALIVSGEVEAHFTEYRQKHYAGSFYDNALLGVGKLYLDEVVPHELRAKNDLDVLIIPLEVIEDAALTYAKFDSCVYELAKEGYLQTMETIRILSSDSGAGTAQAAT